MKFWRNRPTLKILATAITLCAISGTAVVAQTPAAEPKEEMIQRLVLRGNKLDSVLLLLEQLTGRAIIRPQRLPVPEITFDSQGPLTREEMILALESLLSINGIGVTPLGEKFLKVVPVGEVRTQAPELIVGSLKGHIPSGKVVSKLFRLKYLDSQTFQQQIQPFLSPQFSTIIPFENSNAVIVTDTVSNLQRLEYVVSEVDIPSRLNIDTQFYTLQYAQASEVADQIQALIDNARNNFGVTENQRNNKNKGNKAQPQIEVAEAGPAGAAAGGAVPLRILFGSNMAITSDDRTNQLIIMGDPANMGFFEDMIAKLDVKADPTTRMEVINLKHADAIELASLLTDVVSGRSDTDGSDRSTANTNSNNSSNQGRPGPFNNVREQQRAQRNTSQQSKISNSAVGSGEERDSQFSDFMTIIADERTNSLVVAGTRTDMELIREMIEGLDVLLPQVLIEVIIVDVSLSDGFARGSDVLQFGFSQDHDGNGGSGDQSLVFGGAPTTSFGGAEGTTPFTILGLSLTGTQLAGSGGGNVGAGLMNVVLESARTNSKVNVLSTPTILTTHNKEATIVVGEAQPIVTSTQSYQNSSDSTRSNYQFEDITMELKVKPLIGPNDVIQLEVEQKFDEISGTTTINGEDQPIIGRREASSTISIADGELVVLGGLQREVVTESKGQPFLIGSIPLIGELFKKKSKSKSRSELMVFIRPTIMRTTDESSELSSDFIGKLSSGEPVKHFVETGEVRVAEQDAKKDKVKESKRKGKGPQGK